MKKYKITFVYEAEVNYEIESNDPVTASEAADIHFENEHPKATIIDIECEELFN